MTYRSSQGQVIPKARPADMRAYRFWFDRTLAKWCVGPAEGSDIQVLITDEPLRLCEVDVQCHPDGTMTCFAELLADGTTLRFANVGRTGHCRHATLRLLREYEQHVMIPLMGGTGSA